MLKKRGLLVSLIIFVAFVLSMYFDSEISIVASSINISLLRDLLIGVVFASSQLIIFFVLTSFFLWNEGKRKWILPLWFTLLLSGIVSFLLKVTIQRLRPFQEGIVDIVPYFIKDSYYVWDFSFPSAQTALAFCAIPILSKEFPRLKYVWIVLAVLVGFSRLYFGFHFLSDVIAGAVLGWLVGFFVLKIERENKFWERLYDKIKGKFMR